MAIATQRRKREYFIISISYWQGDYYRIDERGILSRKDAELRLQDFRDNDWLLACSNNNYDVKRGRKFRVVSYSEAKKQFGADFLEHMSA